MSLTAQLFPIWRPEQGLYTDKYNVFFCDELIVERSRDPETDLARALHDRGHAGKVTLLDGETGRPRTIIDIEKAAKLRTEEGPHGPRFAKFKQQTVVESPPSPETGRVGMEAFKDIYLVAATTGGGEW
jgi:hypothetical protein